MSSPKQPSTTTRSPPTIRIQRASPEPSDKRKSSPPEIKREPSEELETRRTKSLPGSPRSEHHNHRRKRSATSAHLAAQQDSETSMAGGSSKSSSSSSHKHSSSSKKSKPSSKDLDWSDVTDPEERRRIQNRIAQRKFREKARENKEKTERETRNLEYAGNSYRIPEPSDFAQDSEVSGLPWGGMNMSHCLQRGHAAQSQRSSGRGTYVGDDSFTTGQYNTPQYSTQWSQPSPSPAPAPSYYGGSSGGEEYYYDDSYYYDPTGQSR